MNLGMSAKDMIQRVLRQFGLEIRRISIVEMDQLAKFMAINGIDMVLDVGANIGQFATTLRAAGFKGRIISFEPQSDAHAKLIARSSHDANWEIAPRCAVGAKAGEIEMNISRNSVSSSALPILEAHTGSAPSLRFIRKEKTPVIRLDDCDLIPRNSATFIKVDTQGFEGQVIDGASELLKLAKGVQLELSLAPLYEGQPDFVALIDKMQKPGFETWSINPGFANRVSGRLLQVDATFFRPST